ncbi:ATP-binding protein [Methanomassiliicoccus luminyensis]|uniref:ATP-binding protein n=1 Tax=Methanomassiliicoccus luminyensis TaxID=1080712 RepID=UPI0003746B94|nr:AAA family ATPase [Methanomassiliicoccus luminyensis]
MTKTRPVYPFSAIVGQEGMKEALLLNVINPSIGGVLIRGEKGTAKSTAVRALADLLPERKVVAGCPCGCKWGDWDRACPICIERREGGEELKEMAVPMKVVELPLSSTEDRVAGTLDIEHALKTGKKKFEPGVLAKANGNILYVDEVNLLDDHLVDLLLDAAAMGTNFVEREGVSFAHPARFTLVGTMNPEEGDLRPQLLDRFGLLVDVKAEQDATNRMEVIRRRIVFERDPEGFCEEHREAQEDLRSEILAAQRRLADLAVSDEVLETAVEISLHLGVDGHRADLTLVKAALASAALWGKEQVGREDVIKVSPLVLPHRMRRGPFQDSKLDMKELGDWLQERFLPA